MKIPTAVPSYASLTTLTSYVKSLASAVSAGWNRQHKPDGTHGTITADAVTATGEVGASSLALDATVAAGTVGADVRAGYATMLGVGYSAAGARIAATLEQRVAGYPYFYQVGTSLATRATYAIGGTPANTIGVLVETPDISNPGGGAFATFGLYVEPAASEGTANYTAYFDTGKVMAISGYTERSRSTPMGEWTAVSFSAGNFTASGSMGWTVASGDQITYRYALVGKTMTLAFWLDTTTTTGTAASELRIAIPGGFTAAADYSSTYDYLDTTAGFSGSGPARVLSGGTYVSLFRNLAGTTWAINTDSIYVRGTIQFEVQ